MSVRHVHDLVLNLLCGQSTLPLNCLDLVLSPLGWVAIQRVNWNYLHVRVSLAHIVHVLSAGEVFLERGVLKVKGKR